MRVSALLFLAITCLPAVVHAQAAAAQEPAKAQAPAIESEPIAELAKFTPRGVSLGVAVLWSQGILVGEDRRSFIVPTLGYEGDRLFFRGINGGVRLYQRDGFEFDGILAVRLDGWDAKDLDASALAAVGIDRALLRDRKIGVDAGLGMAWTGKAGKINLEAKGDVTNASGGYEVGLGYRAAFKVGPGLLSPSVGVSYWSDSLTDYYYGTLDREEALGVPRYRPGAAVMPKIGLGYLQRLPHGWSLVTGVEVRWLPSEITNSLLVDDDSSRVPSVFVGVSRAFGAGAR